ncbi:hypothetical protein [Halorhabdus sp. CBA1104]|uniref:DUF7577 domain-containing protein n=1 Tax=Halorhabdus sp. CBA1104 TaxID=1380432 RepID=UPI0012B24891|nr:hypothetical protein [Halorhabdus sp. CBA1104]
MRESLRKQLIWQGAALVSYFAGMILFLVVVMRIVGAPGQSLATLRTGDLLALVVSVFLLGLGGLLTRKRGGPVGGGMGPIKMDPTRGPEQSNLEELGYQIPPEHPADSEPARDETIGHDEVRCPECGVGNDRSFAYCKQCSSELPG